MADQTPKFSGFGARTKTPETSGNALRLSEVEVRPYAASDVVNRFRSRRRIIDGFIRNKAKKSSARFEHKVFCAHRGQSPEVIGFYALQVGGDNVALLPPAAGESYLRNYAAFPAVHLSYLGVHEDFQRQGLGAFLLMDALEKVCRISENCGFYALTLQSLDEQSTAFYSSLNFTAYSGPSDRPKMLYPLADIRAIIRTSRGEASFSD